MKTAYVTGGTGCVGRNIINVLLDDGWRVIATHRSTSKISRLKDLNIELREVNTYNLNEVIDSIPADIDCVFHSAANTSHWPIERKSQYLDNVVSTKNLVEAAIKKKTKKFIFTSTGATDVYKKASKLDANNIKSQYVRTKRLSEIEVTEGISKGLNAVIMLPAIVVGAFDYNSYSQIFLSMAAGKSLGVLPGKIDFCHACDVAKAHLSAFENGKNGSRYTLGGPCASWLEFSENIASCLGVSSPKKTTPMWMLTLASYTFLYTSYITRKKPLMVPELVDLLKVSDEPNLIGGGISKDELGYESSSLNKMVKDCYDWLLCEKLISAKVL